MKRVIFLHGFYASGTCPLALTLKEELEGKAEVRTWYVPLKGVHGSFIIYCKLG